FYDHVVPGWFDKGLRRRRAGATNFRRALLIAPSTAFIQSLPGQKIPDRADFYALDDPTRRQRWQRVADESERLGDELRELLATDGLADRLRPW
nr:patatin-like phospholipase family protein [Gemmatimonadaceae bacterium]